MLTLSSLLLAVALAAPGDIYRCKDAAGAVSYQDHPCAGASTAPMIKAGDDSAASQLALQQWLDGYRQRSDAGRGQPTSRPLSLPRSGTGAAVSEAQLAMCSERFLHCAHGDAATMDRCVDRLPRCGSGGAPCCPQACIARYQGLRQSGQPLASAVRLALLDPDAPACGGASALR